MASSTMSDGSSVGLPSPISTTSPLASVRVRSLVTWPLTAAWNGSPLPASITLPSTATRSPGRGSKPLASSASASVRAPPTSRGWPLNVMATGRLCANANAPATATRIAVAATPTAAKGMRRRFGCGARAAWCARLVVRGCGRSEAGCFRACGFAEVREVRAAGLGEVGCRAGAVRREDAERSPRESRAAEDPVSEARSLCAARLGVRAADSLRTLRRSRESRLRSGGIRLSRRSCVMAPRAVFRGIAHRRFGCKRRPKPPYHVSELRLWVVARRSLGFTDG